MTRDTKKSAVTAWRGLVVGAVAVAVIAAASAVAVDAMTDGMPPGHGGGGSTRTAAAAPDADAAGPSPTRAVDGPPIDAGARVDAPAIDGSEVQDPGTREDRRTAGVPTLRPVAPVFAGPFPKSGAADGALVDGYPDDIAGPFRGDTVIESAIVVDGDVMQVTLTARSAASAADVRREIDARWAALTLTPVPADGDAVTYRGSGIALTLTADETGTGTIYSVFAVIQAA